MVNTPTRVSSRKNFPSRPVRLSVPAPVTSCFDGCTYTSHDGTRGRVCDLSCKTGEPYGTYGCAVKSRKYGLSCRRCYNDVAKALSKDTPEHRAIM